MDEILKIIKTIAEKRFIKDGFSSLEVYPIQDDSFLIINLEKLKEPELLIEDILEFYRDIYNVCNVGSSNNIKISNSIDSALMIKIPLINQGINE